MTRVPIAGSRRHFNVTYWRHLIVSILALASGCAPPCPAAGLRPLPFHVVNVGDCSNWDSTTRKADSLQPTLRWEAFPRPEDLEADKAGRLVTVRDPIYELRIWRADGHRDRKGRADDFPAELVYARSGLNEPVHTVETPLAPDTLYLWTIRARFVLDGEPRVTEWGVLFGPMVGFLGMELADSRGTEVAKRRYYRFKTPKQ